MERMIPSILLTVIAVLLIVLATSRDTAAQLGGNGRYQIEHAVGEGGALVAWRLDTRTGNLSLCSAASGREKPVFGCLPVDPRP